MHKLLGSNLHQLDSSATSPPLDNWKADTFVLDHAVPAQGRSMYLFILFYEQNFEIPDLFNMLIPFAFQDDFIIFSW